MLFDPLDSEPGAYWLGFVAADGYITPQARMLAVELGGRDREHLERLREATGCPSPVRERMRESHLAVRVLIPRRLVVGLDRFGVVQAKTRTLRWPDLPEHLIPHFLRGYMDGNGGFYAYPLPSGCGCYRFSWSLVGNPQFLARCQEWLAGHGFRPVRVQERGPVSLLGREGGAQAERLAELLYRDATIWLDRKRVIAEMAVVRVNRGSGRKFHH